MIYCNFGNVIPALNKLLFIAFVKGIVIILGLVNVELKVEDISTIWEPK